jgi:glycosyltransferase involved in cell wall biosynthesis
VERRLPLQYDRLREVLIAKRAGRLDTYRIPRAAALPERRIPEVPAAPSGAPRAVLIGIHWLEMGGAERWAIETVKLVREAGLLPIVITGRESYHPWIARAELEGALVITLTHPTFEQSEEGENPDEPLIEGILRTFDLAGVYLHHCQWLYDRIPWIRRSRPDVPIVDTLHILEYNGGGYPATSAHFDDYVDLHHVISPQLERWFTGVQGVSADKVVMAPLIELTSAQAATGRFQPRTAGDFTIGFVGRLVRQKRPYLFVNLLDRLQTQGVRVRAILQGSGELDGATRRQLQRHHLTNVELRGHEHPVDATFRDLDLLVITSQNEGLTLTTLEGIANGVPVLSTDVGSQSTLVSGILLAPREPGAFVEKATEAIRALSESEELRERLWREQFDKAKEFSAAESANDWAKGLFSTWRV